MPATRHWHAATPPRAPGSRGRRQPAMPARPGTSGAPGRGTGRRSAPRSTRPGQDARPTSAWSCACLSSAGVVAKDVDAGVAFGHVDDAAAVDQDVFGLVDECGGDGAAALGRVVGDVVAGDVRVVGVGDVVDLQAGVEVGEVDVSVVGGQAGLALLLVLVVRPGPAALLAEAGGVVPGRGAGRGEHRHEDRVGFVGDVDGGGVAGGFVAVLAEGFAVDDDDVAAGQGDRGVDGDGGAER